MSDAPLAQRWPRLVRWLFAACNLVFIVLTYVGLLPGQLPSLWRDAVSGIAPWSMVGFSLPLLVVPPLCLGLGWRVWRSDAQSLLRLLCGVELPLLGMAGLRLFVLHELTAAHAQILVMLFIGAASYLSELLRESRQVPYERRTVWLPLLGQTLGMLIALYLLVIYAPPAAIALFRFLADQLKRGVLSLLALLALGSPFLLLGALLFLVAPVMLARLYARSLSALYRAASELLGAQAARAIPLTWVLASLSLFMVLNRQPQNQIPARLQELPRSDEERLRLLGDREILRRGFRNTYLAGERYLGVTVPDRLPSSALPNAPPGLRAREALYGLYGAIARPFLFDNEFAPVPREQAAYEYLAFFDVPIEKGERTAIETARTALLFSDERERAYRAERERKVWRVLTALQSEPHGDWADIELHEVYESQTGAGEEVLIYFSLPESAVVTSLWAGNSNERGGASPFLVAARHSPPERRGWITPQHLLEQIGPKQYRLRFRADVVPELWQSGKGRAGPCHLWLRYRVLSNGQGFPLPQRRSERNVYESAATSRVIDGRALAAGESFPTHLPGASAPTPHQAVVDGVRVQAQPVAPSPEWPLSQRSLAVILDRSLSMEQVRHEAEETLRTLRGLSAKNDLDFYLSSAPLRGEPPLRIDDPEGLPASATLFFGGDRLYSMLSQFQALRGDKHYDAVLLVTDGESLDSGRDPALGAPRLPPVWLLHLGGGLAAGYSDSVQQAIWHSGGGVTTTLASALSAIERGASGTPGLLMDGYNWTFAPAEPGSPASQDGFASIAAARLIAWRGQPHADSSSSSPGELHRLAVEYGLATPQSALLHWERKSRRDDDPTLPGDRFSLETTSGNDVLHTFEVSASPEPAFWLLLVAVLLYLAYERSSLRSSPR